MNSLPSEIRALFTSHCEKEEVMALRPVSKTLRGKYQGRDKIRSESIIASPQVAKEVRRVAFKISKDLEYCNFYDRGDETPIELVEGYEEAAQFVCKFPNLTGVGIHFSNACSIEDPARWYVGEAAESYGLVRTSSKLYFKD
jgi:hypothetical protein